MVPKRPDTMADMVVAKCVQNRWLNAFFPILILFGAHILSFYEWRVVYQWLGDNSDVTCVSILANEHETFTWKDTFSVFSVLQGSVEALIRWGGKVYHLLIACFLSNISAKYYKNPTMLSRVIAKNIGDVFWDTVYIVWQWHSQRKAGG